MIKVMCLLGSHSAEVPDIDAIPHGWRRVRATVIHNPFRGPDDPWEPGIWYVDPDSDVEILCCPDHQPIDTSNTQPK